MNNKENNEETKVIILSDIRSKGQSILPFGLRLAKHLHAEVDIIHIIDVRKQQGDAGKHGDSKSITPDPKMTFDKIVEREVSEASSIMEKVLSKEASRLNFPLKINKVIKEGRINKEIEESVGNAAQCIVLINQEADDYIFHSRNEIIELIESIDVISLLVPAGIEFKVFKEIVFITDFSNNFGLSSISKTTFLLHKLDPQITAVDVARPKRYLEKELKGNKWSQAFKETVFPNIKTLVLKGKKHSSAFQQYLNKEKPDLVIYSYRKPGFINQLFHNSLLEDLLKKAEYPIIYLS